ncbi:MAG TPA: hypothetical protein VF721_05475 [Pyrinomonadaceae bacterium]|jgi:hypothetical protein
MSELQLGKLESVHGISPVFMQRAAVIAVLSFIFFVAMMVAFSIRQNLGYFLLATAFLLVQLLTLFGWLMQRRAEFRIYENGFTYQKQSCRWDEIESLDIKTENGLVGGGKTNCEIRKTGGKKIVLNESLHGVDKIRQRIRAEIEKQGMRDEG